VAAAPIPNDLLSVLLPPEQEIDGAEQTTSPMKLTLKAKKPAEARIQHPGRLQL
jgi:hypothetical protein